MEAFFSSTMGLDPKLQEYARVVSTKKCLLCSEQPVHAVIIFVFELLIQFQMWLSPAESICVTLS